MKVTSLKPGMIVYDVRGKDSWGGVRYFEVRIVDIHPHGSFTASWNGNTPGLYYRVPSSWRLKKPESKVTKNESRNSS